MKSIIICLMSNNLHGFELLSKASERESSRKLPDMIPMLNAVFGELNHVSFSLDPTLKNPSYSVRVAWERPQEFSRKVFVKHPHMRTGKDGESIDTTSEMLPVFRMNVSVGPNFQVIRDIPALTREVQQKHNQTMREYKVVDKMVFIDTSKALGQYWKFMSQHISTFVMQNKQQLDAIDDTLKPDAATSIRMTILRRKRELNFSTLLLSYAEFCSLIGDGFSACPSEPLVAEGENQDAQDNLVDATLKREWEGIEQNLKLLLLKLQDTMQENGNGNSFKERILKHPQRFLHLLSVISGGRAQQSAIERLNTQSRSVFFDHCEAELFRKAGLTNVFERLQPLRKRTKKSKLQEKYEAMQDGWTDWLRKYFPEDEEKLTNVRTNIRAFKAELKRLDQDANHSSDAQVVASERRRIQGMLHGQELYGITALSALIYSDVIFPYVKQEYSFSDVIDQQYANCMIRSELFHVLCRQYDIGETQAVLTAGHMYSVIPLSDGTYFSLDALEPAPIDIKNIKEGVLTSHETAYLTGVLEWKAAEVGYDPKKPHGFEDAKLLYNEASMVFPESPTPLIHLSQLYTSKGMRDESLQAIRKAMIIAPNDPDVQIQFAKTLAMKPASFVELERKFKLLKTPSREQYEEYYTAQKKVHSDQVEARIQLEETVRNNPKMVNAKLAYAEYYETHEPEYNVIGGLASTIAEQYVRALDLDKTNVWIAVKTAKQYLHMNRIVPALYYLKIALMNYDIDTYNDPKVTRQEIQDEMDRIEAQIPLMKHPDGRAQEIIAFAHHPHDPKITYRLTIMQEELNNNKFD